MNDNVTPPVPATVIPPREEVKQTDVHQQVAALLDVWKMAVTFHADLDPAYIFGSDKILWSALENPFLQSLNPETLITTIDACVNMAMPGSPLYARGIGIVTLTYPDGKKVPAVGLELYPGKQVLMPMSRDTAENFEKLLRTAIDEHFGRIIKP